MYSNNSIPVSIANTFDTYMWKTIVRRMLFNNGREFKEASGRCKNRTICI